MKKSQKGITRRSFLKGLGVVGGTLLATATPRSVMGMVEQVDQLETDASQDMKVEDAVEAVEDKEIVPGSSAVIDFFDTQKIAQSVYYKLTGKELPPFEEACADWGVDPTKLTNIYSYIELLPENILESPKIFAYAFAAKYKDHGETVMEVREKIARFLNFNKEGTLEKVTRENIPDAFNLKGFDFESSEMNPTFWIYLDPEAISAQIATLPEEVINLSFEVGRTGVTFNFFEEKREESTVPVNDLMGRLEQLMPHPLAKEDRNLTFWDGHSLALAEENVPLLAEIARDNPKKIIVASLGNPTSNGLPDIRAVRARLTAEGLWPENLILAGVYGKDPTYGITDPHGLHGFGGDVYVLADALKETLGAWTTSTTSTPVVSGIVSMARKAGFSLQEIKNIFASSVTSRGLGQPGDEYASRIGLRAVRSTLRVQNKA